MNLHLSFVMLEAFGAFATLLLAAALLKSLPRSTSVWLAAALLLSSVGFLLFQRAIMSAWIPPPYRIDVPPPLLLLVQVAMNTTPGVFMLLCFRLFQEERRLPRWLLLLFAVQVALEDALPALFGVTTHPSQFATMTDSHRGLALLFETTPALLQALFVGCALYWTMKDIRTDLVTVRRALRGWVLFVFGTGLVLYSILSRLVFEAGDIAQLYLHELFVGIAAIQNTALLLLFTNLRSFLLPPVVERAIAGPAPDTATLDLDAQAFDAAMVAGAYRETGLTIAGLATRLHMPEYRLRRLVNERLGYRNFNAMLHRYRIAEACEALADPARRNLPILTIALSLGYQSINPFNRAFRESQGCTPSAWRQARLGTSGDADQR